MARIATLAATALLFASHQPLSASPVPGTWYLSNNQFIFSESNLVVNYLCGSRTEQGETATYNYSQATGNLSIRVTNDPNGDSGVFEGVGESLSFTTQDQGDAWILNIDGEQLNFKRSGPLTSNAFEDGFDNTTSPLENWSYIRESGSTNPAPINGELILTSSAPVGNEAAGMLTSKWAIPSLTEGFIVQADIAINEVNGNSYGLLWIPLFTNSSGRYALEIGIESNGPSTTTNTSRTNFVTRFYNEDEPSGQPYRYTQQIKGMGQWHRAKVRLENRTIQFFLDGTLIDQYTLTSQDRLLGCSDGGGRIEFFHGSDGFPSNGGNPSATYRLKDVRAGTLTTFDGDGDGVPDIDDQFPDDPRPGGDALCQDFQDGSISAGSYHTCGMTSRGSTTCWGSDTYGQLTAPPDSFASISAGHAQTCGLKVDGGIECWGMSIGEIAPFTHGFTQVSAGGYHNCGLKSNGYVACWGRDYHGQVATPLGTFHQVSAGYDYTCAVTSDNRVECWGSDQYGQATPPPGMFTQVSTEWRHTCGLKTDGSIACWGDNSYGQSSPPPGPFTYVTVGRSLSCGLKVDDSVACWGSSASGITRPPSGTFVQIDAGGYHACGLRNDGRIECWGDDDREQSSVPQEELFGRCVQDGRPDDGLGNTAIINYLEEPMSDANYTGVGNLRGWALSSAGIDRVEIYIDGEYVFDAPYGGERADVSTLYPYVPNSNYSGYSTAFAYTNLSEGYHTITARAVSNAGAVHESTSGFYVEKFHKPFIFAGDTVDFSAATCFGIENGVVVTGGEIDGRTYDLRLAWDTATQGFKIGEIQEMSSNIDSTNSFDAGSVARTASTFTLSEGEVINYLEEPLENGWHSGIKNLRGWALSPDGIDRVEIYINGQYAFDAPYGGQRADVGAMYPNISDSSYSGYSMAFAYTNLGLESWQVHTITARAVSATGVAKDSSSSFRVQGFHKPFIFSTDNIDLSQIECYGYLERISFDGAKIDDRNYDLTLEWDTASQGFKFKYIFYRPPESNLPSP